MKIIGMKTKNKIMKLYSEDRSMSKRKIAEKCGVSRSYIYKSIKEFEKNK